MFGITLEELHASMVHVPIAFLSIGYLFDLAGVLRRNDVLTLMGFYSLVIGWLGATVAVATGLLVRENAEAIPGADVLVRWHQLNGIGLTTLFGLLILLRLPQKGRLSGSSARIYLVLGVVGTAMVLWQGYIGGRMVYEYGAGTIQR